ncbi:hypothetical protein CERZMDRAFT_86093 [Cercospora zeae-maydis SCOH1-5]|uniref:non-specific serine/threonine protein kinase n=1 Tax=Cercospora zeae-maydis SCOH1-5 TaxID=717836 RepID=A0A6A6FAC0_9PEZI|nr:hypothetical protein CERZMDRAFT_86093 [Cercospora zeae-maydis SCOH1-5]
MAEDTAWVDLHVEAWASEVGEARTERGQNTVQRNARQVWVRRVKQADRVTFVTAAGQRAALEANVARLSPLLPEPNTDDLDILSPWYERAWDLLVARRRLDPVLETMIACIPGNGTASVRTRERYLQARRNSNRDRTGDGLDALENRLGALPSCRPSNYAGSLEDDRPDADDEEGRRIPNYLRRRCEAFVALKGELPGTRDAINAVITTHTHIPGDTAARYVRYLHAETALVDSVMENLTELIEGLSVWVDADTLVLAREQAISGDAPSLDDGVAYENNLVLWEECRNASALSFNALKNLVALREARGDPSTTTLEARLRNLRQAARTRSLELNSQVGGKRSALETRREQDERVLRQSRPVSPWSQWQHVVGAGGHGTVQAWIKTDHNDRVVDRVARKQSRNSNRNDKHYSDVWQPPDSNMPSEVAAMYKLRALKDSSKSIIQIRNWRPVAAARKEYLIYMELCQHGDLMKVRRQNIMSNQMPPEAFLWSIIESLADASLLMQRGEVADSPPGLHNWTELVHGDMQAGNVLLDINTTGSFAGFPRAKLADFGMVFIHPAAGASLERWEDFGGMLWFAPEQSPRRDDLGYSYTDAPSSPANVWGIGMVIRMLIEPQWKATTRDVSEWSDIVRETYSEELINLLAECLQAAPGARPKLADIKGHVRTMSRNAKHDAAIGMRDASADDPRWDGMRVLTDDTDVPLALAKDADGDVEMVGGTTGEFVLDPVRLPRGPSDDSDSDDGQEMDNEEEVDDEEDLNGLEDLDDLEDMDDLEESDFSEEME